MKGKEWYQASDVAQEYEDKRFTGGGRLIDAREREAVRRALAPAEGKRILEIACGTGRFTVMLANEGANVVGIDISGPMLRQGQTKATGTDAVAAFIRGDAARLPFPDDHFDAVFAMRFFHLAPTPDTFLREMRRVSNDVIFFDTFNNQSTRTLYNWVLPMGSRLYAAHEVEELLSTSGIALERVDHDFVVPYGFYRSLPYGIARPIRRADRAVGRTAVGRTLASVSFWHGRVE